jgi:deferrochelatase/peroxidase EfeB
VNALTAGEGINLEIDDIQSGALHERPSPYVGTYLLLRIDDRAAGRDLVRRLLPLVDSGRPSSDPANDAWITVAFTYQGLKALGVPQESLDSPPHAQPLPPRQRCTDRRNRRDRLRTVPAIVGAPSQCPRSGGGRDAGATDQVPALPGHRPTAGDDPAARTQVAARTQPPGIRAHGGP